MFYSALFHLDSLIFLLGSNSFIMHSYTAHCAAFTMKALILHTVRPLKNPPGPSLLYAFLATSAAPSLLLSVPSVLTTAPSSGAVVLCARICVWTRVLMTSRGKMLAQVTTPASPPQNKTFAASWVSLPRSLILDIMSRVLNS